MILVRGKQPQESQEKNHLAPAYYITHLIAICNDNLLSFPLSVEQWVVLKIEFLK